MPPITLPAQLVHPGYRFIKLGSSGEALKRPIEPGWNIFDLEELRIYLEKKAAQWDSDEEAGKHEDLRLAGRYVPRRPAFRGRLNNYSFDEPEFRDWLKRGRNYGVTGAGGLIKLESDDVPRWHELGVLDLLPEGFTVKSSSPTRQHFYFEFEGEIADSPLNDPETNEDIGHIRATGEAGGRGGMVVAPGSLHPHNVRYEVVKDLPIPKIDRETLDKIIAKFQQAGTRQKKSAPKADLKDPFKDVTISQVLGGHYRDFHLEGTQMAGPNPYGSHTNKNGHCLVIDPDDKEFYCFECEQGGGVSRLIAIKAGIMRCTDRGAPTGQAWWETIRHALKEGLINEETAKAAGLREEKQQIETVGNCSLIELGTVFTKWLYIQEAYNLTSFFSGVIANFCDGSPDILGIIGPSGSTKTELIRSLGETQNQYVYPVSTITQHTLVSGHKDSRDLVPQLNGRILAIKDLTSILSSKEEVRSMIFADFRELTDEYIRKEFGNGIAKEYRDIHSSIIFASTTAIERYYSMYSNLGQRMIFFRPQNDPKKARERARLNRDRQKEMRQELHDVTLRFIATMLKVKDTNGLPTTPDHIAEEMGELFDFLAIARTPIHHDYRTGDIDELPEPEFPTRISNTIGRLMEVHAMIHGREEVDNADMAFGCRIISDNIPSMRWKILRALTTEWQHTAKIAQVEDLTIGAVKYHIDELVALKLVEKLLKDEVNSSMDRRFDYYKLSEMAADAIEKYKTRVRAEGNSQDELNKLIEIKNISLSNPCVVSPGNEPEQPPSKHVLDGYGEPVSPPTIGPNPKAEDPGLVEFKKKIKARSDRRTCASCGKHFDTPLVVHGPGGSFICESCRRSGSPTTTAAEAIKGDHQTKLDGEAPA